MNTTPTVAPYLTGIAAKLQDPAVVHAAMLRGEIAKPSIRDMLHLYGADALARWDAGVLPADTEKPPSIRCHCGAMDRFTFGELKPWACTKPGCSALAPDAKPVATLHADGFWTHPPGRDPLGPFIGVSRMDVYAAPVAQPVEAVPVGAIQALEQIHKLAGAEAWEYRQIALTALAQIERAAAHPQQTAPQPLTNDLLERHAVAASDCPPGSEVVLVSSLRRLGIAAPVGHYTPEKLRSEAAAREVAP